MKGYYIGLMSGTSLDGIDAVLVDVDDKIKLLATHHHPLPSDIVKSVKATHMGLPIDLMTYAQLDFAFADVFADAVHSLLASNALKASDIKAIGSHGQTLMHEPDASIPFTIQVGDPNRLAAKTNIAVVADFRRADMANGGQGAPLAPIVHGMMLAEQNQCQGVVNIGGISNLSVVDINNNILKGWDTGPGNALMDAWIMQHHAKAYDHNGHWAAQGQVNETILNVMLDDPFFAKMPPKSIGREYFSQAWLVGHVRDDLSAVDIQATLAALTVESIARQVEQSADTIEALWVCGGGVHNQHVMASLASRLHPIAVASTGIIGWDPDWIEASLFALLAYQRLSAIACSLKHVTGSRGHAILGGYYLPCVTVD